MKTEVEPDSEDQRDLWSQRNGLPSVLPAGPPTGKKPRLGSRVPESIAATAQKRDGRQRPCSVREEGPSQSEAARADGVWAEKTQHQNPARRHPLRLRRSFIFCAKTAKEESCQLARMLMSQP